MFEQKQQLYLFWKLKTSPRLWVMVENYKIACCSKIILICLGALKISTHSFQCWAKMMMYWCIVFSAKTISTAQCDSTSLNMFLPISKQNLANITCGARKQHKVLLLNTGCFLFHSAKKSLNKRRGPNYFNAKQTWIMIEIVYIVSWISWLTSNFLAIIYQKRHILK